MKPAPPSTKFRIVPMARHGRPDIFNTDQGSQFTSPRSIGLLTAVSIRVSMDGRGRWMDYYNADRPHSALGGGTLAEAFEGTPNQIRLAA